jgi:hypothetical protein
MPSDTPRFDSPNAEKSLALASALFPLEEWIPHGKGVFIAKSRLLEGHKEQAKLFREVASIRILTGRGSMVYFLPERFEDTKKGKKWADTVMDGAIVELKTVSGNRTTLGKSFKKGYKQGLSMLENNPKIRAEHDVFLRLYTPFTVESVRAKIAGEIKNTSDKGRCICYFEATEELFYWTYDELRAIVGT